MPPLKNSAFRVLAAAAAALSVVCAPTKPHSDHAGSPQQYICTYETKDPTEVILEGRTTFGCNTDYRPNTSAVDDIVEQYNFLIPIK